MVNGSLKKEDEAPPISVFDYYIECFWELDSTRGRMAVSPIPFTAIVQFAKIYNEDFDEFLYLMRRLDKVYMDYCEKENGKKN